MDVEQMIAMARERTDWKHISRTMVATSVEMDDIIALTRHSQNAHFIAQAPATIVALAERVAELEARLAAVGDTVLAEEITVVEARMEAQRKRLMRHRLQN